MNLENKKQIAVILLAIAMGMVTTIVVGQYIEKKVSDERKAVTQKIKEESVVPLQHKIMAMENEMKAMAEEQQRLREMRVAGGAAVAVPDGTPIAGKSTLSLMTPPGKRAYTVMIDSLSAVGGMINPGDCVDIMAHFKIPDEKAATEKNAKGKEISSIVFQNIQVLAVGTNLKASGQYESQAKARSLNLTFAMTAEEAGLMSFLQKYGQMQLMLRAPAETDIEVLEAASWTGLADYVSEKQGTDLVIPKTEALILPVKPQTTEDVKPHIQIFQGGTMQ